MIKNSFLLFILLSVTISQIFAQENTFSESIDFVGNPYALDDVAFQILESKNNLTDSTLLGIVHYGDSKEEYKLIFEPVLSKQFKKFFKQALKKSKEGITPTTVVFNELSVNVNANDPTTLEDLKKLDHYSRRIKSLGTKNWKNRNYKISVDYLVQDSLVFSDFAEVDSFAHISEYSIDLFCTNFFRESLGRLNKKIIALQLDTNSFINQKEGFPNDSVDNDVIAMEEEGLEYLNARLLYNNNMKIKVKPNYLPLTIKDELLQRYSSREFGQYRLKVWYTETEDGIEIKHVEERSFETIQALKTRRMISYVTSFVVLVVIPVAMSNNEDPPVGPPTGP